MTEPTWPDADSLAQAALDNVAASSKALTTDHASVLVARAHVFASLAQSAIMRETQAMGRALIESQDAQTRLEQAHYEIAHLRQQLDKVQA